MDIPTAAGPLTAGGKPNAHGHRLALVVVTTIFFMWGFLTCLNDILIPHLKAVFELNWVQAMLIQFTFFGAYFLMSLPAGRLVAALGYKKGIVAGLGISAHRDAMPIIRMQPDVQNMGYVAGVAAATASRVSPRSPGWGTGTTRRRPTSTP